MMREKACQSFFSKYEQALAYLDLVDSMIDEGSRQRFFLTILPPKYQHYGKIWDIMNKDTVADTDELVSYFKNIALQEEDSAKNENIALYARDGISTRNNWSNNKPSNSSHGQGARKSCTYCKKSGHSWQECRKRLNRKNKTDQDKKSESKTTESKEEKKDVKPQEKANQSNQDSIKSK